MAMSLPDPDPEFLGAWLAVPQTQRNNLVDFYRIIKSSFLREFRIEMGILEEDSPEQLDPPKSYAKKSSKETTQ